MAKRILLVLDEKDHGRFKAKCAKAGKTMQGCLEEFVSWYNRNGSNPPTPVEFITPTHVDQDISEAQEEYFGIR